MEKIKYQYWQDENRWLGYLAEFPGYMTRGESFEDLREHPFDLYRDLTTGAIPSVRRVAELELAWA